MTHFEVTQMTKRSMQGKPVLPTMIRNPETSKGRVAVWNDTMESGVTV